MIIPTKKLKSGFEMPIYGLGTWKMGGDKEKDTTDDTRDIAAIRMAVERGVKLIDTAEVYGSGHAEELVAAAISGAGQQFERDKLFITSKVLPAHLRYDDLLKSCENSLKRLQMDYVDLYLIHFPPPADIDIRDTIRAMDEIVRRGWAQNIGVSNFTPNRYDQAQALTENKLVVNQVNYSLMVREIESHNLPEHAVEKDYILQAWRPLELSYQPGVKTYPPIVEQMAKKYGKTSNQIAINWLISQPNVTALSKTANPEHLDENLGAIDWTIEKEDIEKLRREYPADFMMPPRYQLDEMESSMEA